MAARTRSGDAPPVEVESGRCITLNKNGALLRVGDKAMTDVETGEVRIEIEHSPVTIMVPSAPAKTVKTREERSGTVMDLMIADSTARRRHRRRLLREIESAWRSSCRASPAPRSSTASESFSRSATRASRSRSSAGSDPVSEVDGRVEQLIRARLAEKFPGHDILGEESEERPGRGHDFIWAIDPIDGTTNFINGFPAFAASIGVLYRGRPIVGALWCASTHALRAGVYHAHRGGLLHFDDEPLKPAQNPAIMRRLAGEPNLAHDKAHPFEVRKTGSAAIECAFVAAGLLRVARFERPNVWDIAGGVALVQAAGGEVLTLGRERLGALRNLLRGRR